jgi:hypothetical protein
MPALVDVEIDEEGGLGWPDEELGGLEWGVEGGPLSSPLLSRRVEGGFCGGCDLLAQAAVSSITAPVSEAKKKEGHLREVWDCEVGRAAGVAGGVPVMKGQHERAATSL